MSANGTAGHTYRLVPGLVRFAAGDAYLVEGGPASEAFTGPGAVDVLPQLCDLLDGHHSVGQIAAALRVPVADVTAGIELLAQRGLVRPAASSPGDPAPAESPNHSTAQATAFLGRTVGYRCRADSAGPLLANLWRGEVLLVGDDPLSAAISDELRRAGVTVRRYQPELLATLPPVAGAGQVSAIVIETLAGETSPACAAETLRAGHLWLAAGAGATGAFVGPLLYPGLSCPCQCSPPPAALGGPAAPELLDLTAALTVGEVIHALGGGADVTTLDGSVEVTYPVDGAPAFVTCRRHRSLTCPACGQPGIAADRAADGQLAWGYEQEIEVAPPALDALEDTKPPYDSRHLQRRRRTLPTCPSIASDTLPASDPLRGVTKLLAATVGGHLPDGDGFPRLVNSSAGNLGSPQAFLVSRREIPGLASHCAWYDEFDDRLVATGRVDGAEVTRHLGDTLAGIDWGRLVVWVGDLDRVATKYADLALRLVHLDAGVVIGHAFLVAPGYALTPSLLTRWNAADFAGLLDLDLSTEIVTGIMIFPGDVDE